MTAITVPPSGGSYAPHQVAGSIPNYNLDLVDLPSIPPASTSSAILNRFLSSQTTTAEAVEIQQAALARIFSAQYLERASNVTATFRWSLRDLALASDYRGPFEGALANLNVLGKVSMPDRDGGAMTLDLYGPDKGSRVLSLDGRTKDGGTQYRGFIHFGDRKFAEALTRALWPLFFPGQPTPTLPSSDHGTCYFEYKPTGPLALAFKFSCTGFNAALRRPEGELYVSGNGVSGEATLDAEQGTLALNVRAKPAEAGAPLSLSTAAAPDAQGTIRARFISSSARGASATFQLRGDREGATAFFRIQSASGPLFTVDHIAGGATTSLFSTALTGVSTGRGFTYARLPTGGSTLTALPDLEVITNTNFGAIASQLTIPVAEWASGASFKFSLLPNAAGEARVAPRTMPPNPSGYVGALHVDAGVLTLGATSTTQAPMEVREGECLVTTDVGVELPHSWNGLFNRFSVLDACDPAARPMTTRNRPYDLVVPDTTPSGPIPLVVMLHPFKDSVGFYRSANPERVQRARAGEFYLAFPYATELAFMLPAWNAARGGVGPLVVDDVEYVRDVIAEVKRAHAVSTVHLFGYSLGGFMANLVACSGEPVQSVLTAAGTAFRDDQGACAPVSGVRWVHIHGDQDETIQIGGGVFSVTGILDLPYIGAASLVESRAGLNGCAEATATAETLYGLPATHYAYACASGSVERFDVAGADHLGVATIPSAIVSGLFSAP